MELMDVTLRESVYYANGMDREGRLAYLRCLCDRLSHTLLQDVEISFIDTDIPDDLNYDPAFIADAHAICDGTFRLAAMLHPGRADMSRWDPAVIRLLDRVRIMVPLGKMESAKPYIDRLHGWGVKVACNLLYTASAPLDDVLETERQAAALGADFFTCADSSGSFTPGYTRTLCDGLRAGKGDMLVGLHLHDHMHMALANTLLSRDGGMDLGDVSITGAGKGGGNLKMEEALLALMPREDITPALLSGLYDVVQTFDRLVGNPPDEHIRSFMNFLTGLFRLNLKDIARLEAVANGCAATYFEELLR